MSTIRILGLATLTVLSLVPLAKPAPPVLTTQLFSQSVQLSQWQSTITLPFNNTSCPGNPNFNPSTPETIGGANFTENLSGRDVGSSWIQFKTLGSSEVYLFKVSDLSPTLVTEFICTIEFSHFQSHLIVAAQANFLILMGSWRVPASGTYALLFANPPSGAIYANETWTVTTIS